MKPMLILVGGGTCAGKGSLVSVLKKYKESLSIETDDFTTVRQTFAGREIVSGIDCSEEKETEELFNKSIDL